MNRLVDVQIFAVPHDSPSSKHVQIGVQMLRTHFYTKMVHMIRNIQSIEILKPPQKMDEQLLRALQYLVDWGPHKFSKAEIHQIRMASKDGGWPEQHT